MSSIIRSVLGYWSSAIDLCKKHFLLVLLIAVVDIVFFFVLGFATSYFVDRIFGLAVELTQRMSSQLTIESTSGLLGILFLPGLSEFTWKIMGFMVLTLLVTYVTYVIVQGFAWYLASSPLHQRDWQSYLQKFAKVNAIWFVFFAAFFVTNMLVDLRYTIISSIAQAAKPVLPYIPIYLFLLATIYFAFLSYGTLSVKESWVRGKTSKAFATFLSIILVLGVFDGIIIMLAWLGGSAALIVSLIGLPLISIIRWVMLHASQEKL